MATLVDALWIMALNAVLNDDESELRGYLFDWMPHLERGADVWLAWISSEP